MDQLKELNRYFRTLRSHNPKSNYIDYFFSGDFLEIAFPNICCSYDKNGCCTMCNYGTGNAITNNAMIIKHLMYILEEYRNRTDTLLIGTNGSVLDNKNFQFDFLCEALKVINEFPYNIIIFETHFSTITCSVLQLLKKLLPNKKIFIESGLESSNDIVQKYCYAKPLPLNFVKEKIQLIHDLDMQAYINVILGAPFLTTKEQKQDCLDTVKWILNNNCKAVIFPLNIKPYTTIEYMYKHALYTPVSLWMLLDVLNSFSDKELEQIDVTWYGNRQDEYVGNDCKTVFPKTCNKCSDKLRVLFDQYNSLKTGLKKYNLLQDFTKETRPCKCFDTYINTLSVPIGSNDIAENIYRSRKLLFDTATLDKLLPEV